MFPKSRMVNILTRSDLAGPVFVVFLFRSAENHSNVHFQYDFDFPAKSWGMIYDELYISIRRPDYLNIIHKGLLKRTPKVYRFAFFQIPKFARFARRRITFKAKHDLHFFSLGNECLIHPRRIFAEKPECLVSL